MTWRNANEYLDHTVEITEIYSHALSFIDKNFVKPTLLLSKQLIDSMEKYNKTQSLSLRKNQIFSRQINVFTKDI